MITFEEAYQTVINSGLRLGTEKVNLQDSLGRVMSEDVFSDINMPPFDKSAMDGYACKAEDIYNELDVVEIIPAGKMPEKKIQKNQCAKIMTGAPVPEGADTVFIVEESEETGKNKVRYIAPDKNQNSCNTGNHKRKKSNICYIGEDVRISQKVLNKGTIIKPQHIAVLASVGHTMPLVSERPKVGVIATGSELVEPEKKPGISQIRNSNGSQMVSQLQAISVIANYYGIAEDDEEITYEIIKKARDENHIVMLSGGVSMGDFDFVPLILKKLNFEIKFDKVAIQPGKPTTFAIGNNKFCFGMPGNPVSSFVQFELMAKPLLYNMMGANYNPLTIKMPLGKDYTRKRARRLSWIPVNITKNGEIVPIEYHGSAHINGLAPAEGLMPIPIGVKTMKKGEIVNVRQI
jgi:molybdopterin molybdotransferase